MRRRATHFSSLSTQPTSETSSADLMVKIFKMNAKPNDFIEVELPFDFVKYLGSENCDVQRMCRICFCVKKKTLQPLYQTKDGMNLSEIFTSFTGIVVQEGDGLPSYICQDCVDEVTKGNNFKIKCLKADHTLTSILKGEINSQSWISDVQEIRKVGNDDNLKVESSYVKFEEEEYLDDGGSDIQYLEDIDETISKDAINDIEVTDKTEKYELQFLNKEESSSNTIGDPKYEDDEVFAKPKKKFKSHFCDFCAKKYSSMRLLKTHIKLMHNSSEHPNSCKKCKESFVSEDDLRLHTVMHAAGPVWPCIVCKKEYPDRLKFRRHIQRHMQVKRHTCEACGKAFTELYALRRHSRVHTGERVAKPHACTLCDKRYANKGQLDDHMLRHTGARPCVCAECGKGFPSRRLLASHQLTHSEARPHECRYCDKRFRHESTRNTHHRTHTGEKPYICSICGKGFIQNSNLTLHMRVHTGEKPYTCEKCGRKFSSGSTLKMHLRSHTGDRPYACDVCGKQFARKDMTAHARTHTGERPHTCGVCGRKFARLPQLKDHCRIHTGEKPFECDECSQKFPTRARLLKHFKVHQTKKKKTKTVKKIVAIPYSEAIKMNLDTSGLSGPSQDKLKNEISNHSNNEVIVESEVNFDGSELILPEDSEMKSDLLVIDDNTTYQDALCLSSDGVIVNSNDVNLVTVNEGEVSISSSTAMVEGTTVKLYQVDQSLVQIQSIGGQVTISKITSKMTANF